MIALEALKAAIDRSGAQVECEVDECVKVRLEISRLMQVLQNIICNAVQYRVPGRVPAIRIEAKPCEAQWEFSIRDNGSGIDERYWQTIFEPFKRLHGQENPGSGIGLATCKRIVERAGGSIRVTSQPNAGTTFYFLLPKAG